MNIRVLLSTAVVLGAMTTGATVMLAADTQPATASRPATGSRPTTTSQPASALQAIRYQRSGGFVGTNDVIEITPAGEVTVQGRLLGNGKGQLKPEQIAKLAPLFADWKSLKDSYPAPAGSADMFQIKIRYGTREITASEGNAQLPASFKAAQAALEQIAKDVTGK
jgi:hypothetical protein